MKEREGQHVVVYEGSEWECNLVLSLLKANQIQTAVLLNHQDSAYKGIFNTNNQIFVHQSEQTKALEIIKESSSEQQP
ncbi:MAG: hypothetical protein ACRC9P_06330 [Bacteroides sp.]